MKLDSFIIFLSICPGLLPTMLWLLNSTYCPVVFECCSWPPVQVRGCVLGLLFLEQKESHRKPASTRGYTQRLQPFSLFPVSPSSSNFSTFTSMLSVCQRFPSGGVRHGVRVPELPAHAVTSSPATSAPRANATAGHHWAFTMSRLPLPGIEIFHAVQTDFEW